MKWKIIILSVIISLALFSYGFSEEVSRSRAKLDQRGICWCDRKEGGRAKFTEYRDLRARLAALFGRARLKFDSEKYFLNFEQAISAMTHNITRSTAACGENSSSTYSTMKSLITLPLMPEPSFQGAGHHTLIGTPNTNFSTWNTFDYSIERRQYGGGLKVNLIKTFLLRCLIPKGGQGWDKTGKYNPGKPR